MPVDDFKALTRFSETSFLSFILQCIFRIAFNSNNFSIFSKMNAFIACHHSKISLQSERKAWPKTIDFFFRKKMFFLKTAVPEFQK